MSTVDNEEVDKFRKLADRWWDPKGPQEMLRLMNPVRIGYIRHNITGTTSHSDKPLKGLSVLDVGCGGGFASEALARLGADVLGVDAAEEAILAAERHAEETGLIGSNSDFKLQYKCGTSDTIADQKKQFDIVTALDIIEHVNDQTHFLCTCLSMVKPGGSMFISTINRTPTAYALAVFGAEYVARLVPPGTHDWNKFVTPEELKEMVTHYEDFEVLNTVGGSSTSAVTINNVMGMCYEPFKHRWGLDANDLSMNYIAHIKKLD